MVTTKESTMDSSEEEELISDNGRIAADSVNAPMIPNSVRSREDKVPYVEDRCHLVYVIFYILGIGCLLPWNFFSNAKNYFSYKLRNNTLNASTTDWDDASTLTQDQILFINYLQLAGLLPTVLFMLINIAITNMISMQKRIMGSLVVLLVAFLVTAVLTSVSTDEWQKGFLYISLATVVVMNAACAILQGGLFGLTGKFPVEHSQSLMSGMALGGLFASLMSLLITSTRIFPITSGLIYFVIALVTVALCMASYSLLPRIRYASYFMNSTKVKQEVAVGNQDYVDIVVNTLASSRQTSLCYDGLCILRKIWMHAVSLCTTYAITLACYPALMSAITSSSSNKTWADVYFTPVACFVVFNLFDFIGRNMVKFLKWPKPQNPECLIVLSLLRLAFVPAFFFCNVQPRRHTAPLFVSDWIPTLLNIFLGWTNGHIATLAMMHSTRTVTSSQAELSGSIMSFFLAAGLAVGSLSSMLFMKIL